MSSCWSSVVTVTLTCVIIITIFHSSMSARNQFRSIPAKTGCVCPGDVLTFNCTAVGTGTTQWGGTAFNCSGKGNSIILRHQRFNDPGGVAGECNNRTILGRSIEVDNDCYTSQLNFTVTPSFNNKTVSCTHTSSVAVNIIGTSMLTIMEAPYPPPHNVHLIDASEGKLTFIWTSSLGPNCTSVTYGISSDCGSCSATTNVPNVSCPIMQLSGSAYNCTFSVHFIICGSNGQSSEAIEATLKAPDVPRVRLTPLYSDKGTLLGFTAVINQEAPFVIAGGIFGNITGYNFYFYSDEEPTSSNSTCVADMILCEYMVNVPPLACATSANIDVTTTAVNVLGEGPLSDPTIIECTNEFVMVNFNFASSILSCMFLDELDTSDKSCSVQYNPCESDQGLMKTAYANTTSTTATLKLNVNGSDVAYCYILTARNSTYEIIVKGRIDGRKNSSVVMIIVPIVAIIALLLIMLVVVASILILYIRKKYRGQQTLLTDTELCKQEDWKRFTKSDLLYLKLRSVDLNERWITKLKVDCDSSLKDFMARKNLIYKRGYIFYEFNNPIESISMGKQLIFINKEEKYFSPIADSTYKEFCEQKLIGEMVLKPSLEEYVVFVQSTGSGTRHLAQGSHILYERLQPHPLWHVDKERIKIITIDNNSEQIFEDHDHDNIYLELDFCKDEEKLDVIAQDVETKEFFTGPYAFKLAEYDCIGGEEEKQTSVDYTQPSGDNTKETHRGIKQPGGTLAKEESQKEKLCYGPYRVDVAKYKLFVLRKFKKGLKLKKGAQVLYQQKQTEEVLTPITSDQLKMEMLASKCSLEEFQRQHDLDNNENNVFVEVSIVQSDIHRDDVLDVILIDKEKNNFFTSSVLRVNILKNAPSTSQEQWKTFVLCKFKGSLQLPKKSLVLYRVNRNPWRDNGLMPIYAEHLQFSNVQIQAGDKLGAICKQHHLENSSHYLFLEWGSYRQGRDVKRDVILMDKQAERLKLFTGPYARQMCLEEDTGKENEDRWRVFVPKKIEFINTIKWEKNSCVLYQKKKKRAQFHVLKVDDSSDNVRMSEFIKKKLHIRFENGKAFYEFTQNDSEDLLYYKEVALVRKPTKKEFPQEGEVWCEVQPFYKISGTPGMAIMSPSTDKEKWFIQSTSHGSRCLKRGTFLLYKKKSD